MEDNTKLELIRYVSNSVEERESFSLQEFDEVHDFFDKYDNDPAGKKVLCANGVCHVYLFDDGRLVVTIDKSSADNLQHIHV